MSLSEGDEVKLKLAPRGAIRINERSTQTLRRTSMSRSPSRSKRPRPGPTLTQHDLAMTAHNIIPQSLLSARRPTYGNAPSISFRDVPAAMQTLQNTHNARDTINLDSEPSSPEDAGTFKRSMQIDNKGLVGDAVGNVSSCRISRSSGRPESKLISAEDEHKPVES